MLCRRRDPSNAFSNGCRSGRRLTGCSEAWISAALEARAVAIVQESTEIDGGGRGTRQRQNIVTRDSAAITLLQSRHMDAQARHRAGVARLPAGLGRGARRRRRGEPDGPHASGLGQTEDGDRDERRASATDLNRQWPAFGDELHAAIYTRTLRVAGNGQQVQKGVALHGVDLSVARQSDAVPAGPNALDRDDATRPAIVVIVGLV
jgi:hypothetical protein